MWTGNTFSKLDIALFDIVLSAALLQWNEQELHLLSIFGNEALVVLCYYQSPCLFLFALRVMKLLPELWVCLPDWKFF